MEDTKKINENTTAKEEDFDWGEGIEELKEGDIDIILRPTVKIPQERYEELVKAEATLEILCRVINQTKPYGFKTLAAIAGKYIPAEEGDDKE